ncbi:putative UPF0481 protein At3g02645 [Brachypodium distachyon]|uniref:Uncharacterized protein n=1 Tax=Brachypodium distachyon TaxID=15368 RepID=I1H0H3_BRADI|nr:putative UPF0481 protein At3g02645 [Brachypodium distachyon]KQK19340.1 hypothetical protein BRADI_1g47730v3 [Brachypodium distachyon]|eukprot:XP_003561017.1 putative UPF0481 protein At3g02645 [Brachypodium distachyon]
MAASDQESNGSGSGSGRRRSSTPLAFDEVRWVVQIRESLQEVDADDEDDTGIPVSIFNVPKQLQVHKPEAYVPQLIALGPYHHWRPELYEMERYKLASARRLQRRLCSTTPGGRGPLKLDALVAQFAARLERKIRAHYHRYLDLSGETLSWMMAVDGAFLLEFLQIYAAAEDGDGPVPALRKRVSSRMAHLVDFAGRKSAHGLILRDMVMLENQIPLFLLRRILEPQCASADEAAALLAAMVTGVMKELCPFKMMDTFPAAVDVSKHAHLLELLYYLLVPKPAESTPHEHEHDEGYDIEEQSPDGEEKKSPSSGSGGGSGAEHVQQLFAALWAMASKLTRGPLHYIMKPIAFAVKAPWKMLAVVPGVSGGIKHPVESLFSTPPLIEEIMVPSVTELINAGIQIAATTGDIATITFDAKTSTLHLPAVTLDGSTEVTIRNLVAYESAAATGPLVLTRYTELMNGIIDADEDVSLLRARGVVLNRMKSDGDVTRLWNGMSRSVRLTRVAAIDKAVEEMNKCYDGRWRVKAKRFMRRYVFGSWQLLTFLAAILMLLLTTLQAFCSVYTCSRWFGAVTVTAAAAD